MRCELKIEKRNALTMAGVLLLTVSTGLARADEPSRLGRLFRIGGSGSNPPAATKPASSAPRVPISGAPVASGPALNAAPMPIPATPAPSTPSYTAPGSSPRIAPQPRNSKPPTEADPIVTRIAIGRSDNGSQFGMFMHVYADGTVVDSEGVHRVSGESLKPVFDALRMGELYRQKGHCGGPPTDFVEQVHVVVYDRNYGKLRATAFTYSGNTHGCDPSVKHLHTALDNLQAKMAGQPVPAAAPTPTGTPSPRAAVSASGPVLGLTPTR